MSKWQPIETAPKDGTEFIAWCEYDGVYTASYCNITNEWVSSWRNWEVMDGVRCSMYYYKELTGPTHWQPLPHPPKP